MFAFTVNLNYVLKLTCTVFLIGIIGIVFNWKNILIAIMSIELLFLAVNLNFASFSIYLDDITGQVFILFILTIAAAESSIGLAILTVKHKLNSSIELKPIKKHIYTKI